MYFRDVFTIKDISFGDRVWDTGYFSSFKGTFILDSSKNILPPKKVLQIKCGTFSFGFKSTVSAPNRMVPQSR
jgi:hypothetical protein